MLYADGFKVKHYIRNIYIQAHGLFLLVDPTPWFSSKNQHGTVYWSYMILRRTGLPVVGNSRFSHGIDALQPLTFSV
jgi:hypothetical protein